jgi:hypothetical protein
MLLFIMVDRWDEDSVWVQYWLSLPSSFRTGLSFPPCLIELLEGTAAWEEVTRAQEHLRASYDATRPAIEALLQAYPTFLQAEWFTHEAFVWAAELVCVVVIIFPCMQPSLCTVCCLALRTSKIKRVAIPSLAGCRVCVRCLLFHCWQQNTTRVLGVQCLANTWQPVKHAHLSNMPTCQMHSHAQQVQHSIRGAHARR